MAKTNKQKHSEEEILSLASSFIVGLINPQEMGLSVDELDIDKIKACFKEIAKEMLTHQDSVFVTISNSENDYSEDMRTIMNALEEKMEMQFCFYGEALLSFGYDHIFADWSPL